MLETVSLYVALAVCGLGLIYKGSTWFRHSIGNSAGDIGAGKRIAAASRGVLGTVLGAGFLVLLRVFLVDVLLERKLFRQDRRRWLAHMSIFVGFTMLLLMHAMAKFTSMAVFRSYLPTLNPFWFLRDLFGAMVLLGLGFSIYRRFLQKSDGLSTNGRDVYAIVIVAAIVLSGVLLEGAKISSYSAYQEMVESYAGGENAEPLQALEAYWVESFGVVSPHGKGPFDPAKLAQGQELHQAVCAECHAPAGWGFLGYGAAKAMGPVALAADRANLRSILRYVHFLASFLGLALLPFSKMLHIVTSPLSLMVNAVMAKGQSDRANEATRQILELDACTHCGLCTAHCAVAVAYQQVPNVNILPSEKIGSLRRLAGDLQPSLATVSTIQQGLFLCTNCYRCTAVCPVGINLQELWFDARERLLEKNQPEFLLLSPLSLYRGLMQTNLLDGHYEKPLDLARQAIGSGCDQAAVHDRMSPLQPGSNGIMAASGLSLEARGFSSCFRCMTCSNACPVVRSFPDPMRRLGLLPHQIMHATALKLWDLVFSSRMLWDCLGCYQCQEHCPMSVRPADIIGELKSVAIERAIAKMAHDAEEKS